MIKLTLLDNSEILINVYQIEKVESTEPSKIILKQGDEIEVKESAVTIFKLIKALSHRDDDTCQ